jgi:hypothetical protein
MRPSLALRVQDSEVVELDGTSLELERAPLGRKQCSVLTEHVRRVEPRLESLLGPALRGEGKDEGQGPPFPSGHRSNKLTQG